MSKLSDYKIVEYRTTRQPDVQKYQIRTGGQVVSTYSTYEEAARDVVNLILDPWYHDR